MNRKSRFVFFVFVTLFTFLSIEIIYLTFKKSMDSETLNKKLSFLELSKLPDLAISTEATYVRHRSLSTVGSIYKDDGSLREYFPSTYALSHSHIKTKDEK